MTDNTEITDHQPAPTWPIYHKSCFMPKNKNQLRVAADSSKSASAATQLPTVSPRWLLTAIAIALAAAAFCAWATLCLLFWQGNWQLLYHPKRAVTRTPASVGLQYDPLGFAATEVGQLRLQGWWIPAAPNARFSRYTVLYLHGQDGNLGNTVDALTRLHSIGLNVFAFDYRGYGQSQFAHPSEARWLEDTNWALDYLASTRHIDPHSIILNGDRLGANLALEAAAAHPQLAGVVLESPLQQPMSAIFSDPRARLLPAHLLVRDRYDLNAAAAALRIPSLWLLLPNTNAGANKPRALPAFDRVSAPKQLIQLNSSAEIDDAFARWLDGLSAQ